MSNLVLAFSVIAAVALGAQWLAWRLRLPAILFLLAAGFLLGPATHALKPDELLGDLLFPLVALAVAVILFEGALTLRFSEIRGLVSVVRNLVTVGMLATFAMMAAACHFLLGLSVDVSLLFGAVTVVTGPTVIAPLLRTTRPKVHLDRILRWEGIIIDPIGAIFAVLVFELVSISSTNQAMLHMAATFCKTLASGGLIGLAAGVFVSAALMRGWVPQYLRKVGVLGIVLFAYAITESLQHEAGLLTVTVMGIYMANKKGLEIEDILEFKEDLSVILISALFILLAARLDFHDLITLGLPLVGLLALVQFVIRPLSVGISTIGSHLGWGEKLFLSWIAPRGIVAAAVSSLFALRLDQIGIADAHQLMPLTFAVIIATVVLQSLSAQPVAKLLNVEREPPKGVMFIGANTLARTIALALKKNNFDVLLADPVWENYRLARMEGLECYYGNPQSEHAEAVLDFSSILQVYAFSPNRHQNAMAIAHFAHRFGTDHVFSIRSSQGKGFANQESALFRSRQILFNEDCTFSRMNSLVRQRWQVKTTSLRDAFNWDAYKEKHPNAIPLFVISTSGALIPIEGEKPPTCGNGDVIISLAPSEVPDAANSNGRHSGPKLPDAGNKPEAGTAS